ncbi:MAG: ribulose-phosphate 3-epimerase [Clostridia bacterium]|nr:ribulose-phosphate 3-epimerase [Clostridia bacterium]
MNKKVLIAPSTHPCPLKDLSKYAKELELAGADWLHCDIMDGKFVPARTFDQLVVAFLKKSTNLLLDVHLMIKDPMRVVAEYVKYGANNITIHYECFDDKIELINALQQIKKLGVNVGISLKPQTPIENIFTILPYVDLVLVMSVEPGASGQTFIKSSIQKIAKLNKKRNESGYNFIIEVDGGINTTNAQIVAISGADVLVSGSEVYKSSNRAKTIEKLKSF